MAAEEPEVATTLAAAAAVPAEEEVKPEKPEEKLEEKEAAAPAAAEEVKEAAAPAAAAEEVKEEAQGNKDAEDEASRKAARKVRREELEKKALQELKIKVAEAIKLNEFAAPPKEEEAAKAKEEEAAKEEAAAKEGVAKEEEAAKEGAAKEGAAKEGAAKGEAAKEEVAKEEAAKGEAAKEEAAKGEEAKEETEAEVKEEAAKGEEGEEEVKATEELAAAAAAGEEVVAEEVSLWGIPLLDTAGDDRTDVILTKFLQARDFKVPAAFSMLKRTVQWRESYKPGEAATDGGDEAYGRFAYMFGCDRSGHPVCYNVFGALHDKELYAKAVEQGGAPFLRWRIGLMEKGVKLLSFEPSKPNALLQVIDLKNSPWPGKKELRGLVYHAIELLQDNYPELVTKNVFINVPWYYSAIFSVVSFLTQRQVKKIVIARPGRSTEVLFKYISPKNVPLVYGGLGRAADDTEFSGAEAPVTELGIKAGEVKTIELPVTTSGATVSWDMVVVGADVTYGAEFQPDKEGGYTTIVEKPKKVSTAEEQAIRNSFATSEPGKIVLTIDNTLSRKKKLVVYRYIVKVSSS